MPKQQVDVMKTKYLIAAVTVFLMTACMNLCIAQGDDNPDDPGPLPDTPVDGGVTLLLAAGVAYGVRRVMRNAGAHKK
jgi:hypothetical protein